MSWRWTWRKLPKCHLDLFYLSNLKLPHKQVILIVKLMETTFLLPVTVDMAPAL